jgi:hypothetical protein
MESRIADIKERSAACLKKPLEEVVTKGRKP